MSADGLESLVGHLNAKFLVGQIAYFSEINSFTASCPPVASGISCKNFWLARSEFILGTHHARTTMPRTRAAWLSILLLLVPLWAAEPQAEPPSLTIYNQKFAVIRQTIPLELNGERDICVLRQNSVWL